LIGGANVSNLDFISTPDYQRPGKIRWVPKDTPLNKQTDEGGHGTCVASKAVGNKFGVAKSADLVLVKPVYRDKDRVMEADIIRRFSVINKDVNNYKLQGKAVVNISIGVRDPTKSFTTIWKEMIKTLLGNDVVVVVASRNDRVGYSITSCRP
jgi:subtilisin family serine protease